MGEAKGASLSRKAVMELRDLILGGTLPPGERLYEVPLSERLGISRTPMREAMAKLEQEGLLERIPAGGYAVRTFTFEDVIDAIELRGVMEGTAARLAAERGVEPVKLRQFRKVVEALDRTLGSDVKKMDFDGYVELNSELHELLAGLSGSEMVRREVERASRLAFASPSAFLREQEDVLEFRRSLIGAQAQHRALLEAIEAREGSRAEAVAREHARLARQNLEYVMFQDRSLIVRVPGLALVAT
ncbi:GntR family transcriptional regulator [Polymorphum gilvum]|uniref:Putative GntR family transcriptional regulator n=1 Tax=Polymorphum gilvum (strain LMG 25793 / CGMCC 1.9160 / SL003B-26A1) TaxID=991905 RepID=F2J6B1_POLGS|nr:GntR family transcriptional regulator [Polymorphum gilvum]ADZ71285.1 Putative GntR family transcriptional regulator [Polymorphum gilvum SL003B-26A1]